MNEQKMSERDVRLAVMQSAIVDYATSGGVILERPLTYQDGTQAVILVLVGVRRLGNDYVHDTPEEAAK